MAEDEKPIDAVPVRKFGGPQPGSGRPPKAVEMGAARKAIGAIVAVYGSEENYWKFIAEKSVDSLPHLAMLHQYGYGKPAETKDINIKTLPSVQAILITNDEADPGISENIQD